MKISAIILMIIAALVADWILQAMFAIPMAPIALPVIGISLFFTEIYHKTWLWALLIATLFVDITQLHSYGATTISIFLTMGIIVIIQQILRQEGGNIAKAIFTTISILLYNTIILLLNKTDGLWHTLTQTSWHIIGLEILLSSFIIAITSITIQIIQDARRNDKRFI